LTFKFAHISDVHIGAFRQPVLQRLVLDAFIKAMDDCIERGVDFVVIGGDLFDSGIPNMALANQAVRKMKEVRDRGIPIYLVYGSHDFSPTQTSVVDMLESAGLFRNVSKSILADGKLELDVYTDKKTGAKLCGIYGRRLGIEADAFKALDRAPLEALKGFKVFVFHGSIAEFAPEPMKIDSIPLSDLPKGFSYYAGGHLHDRMMEVVSGMTVAYPGALFAGGDYQDLEKSAKGLERGFYLVEFGDRLQKLEFVPVKVCEWRYVEYDAAGKNSVRIRDELMELAREAEVANRVVLLRVSGEMTAGKTSDIDFVALRKIIRERGAIETLLNYNKLTSKEYAVFGRATENPSQVEDELFRERIATVKFQQKKLDGQQGIVTSKEVLRVLKDPKKEDEVKDDYESRLLKGVVNTMGLEDAFE
jgi:DNA repair protein SbcD/Mre11